MIIGRVIPGYGIAPQPLAVAVDQGWAAQQVSKAKSIDWVIVALVVVAVFFLRRA